MPFQVGLLLPLMKPVGLEALTGLDVCVSTLPCANYLYIMWDVVKHSLLMVAQGWGRGIDSKQLEGTF